MKFRFLKDRHNGKLHMWNRHQLTRKEVLEAFPFKKTEYVEPSRTWIRTCKTLTGRLMEIVYLKKPDHYFIITAYYIT